MRRNRLALVVPLGIAGVAAMFYFGPALSAQVGGGTWKARAMLLVRDREPTVLRDAARGAGMDKDEVATFWRTQDALIKSRLVLSKAMSHPKVAKLPSVVSRPDPIEWLQDKLSVTFTGEVLYIGLESDNEQDVVMLVNAVTYAYLDEVVNADNNRRKERLAKLKAVYDKYQEEMKLRQQNLKVLAERVRSEGNDPLTLSLRRQMLLRDLSNGARESLRVKLDKGEAEALLEIKKAAKVGGDDARKAIAALEERLTVLTKQEQLLADEKSRLYAESRSLNLAAMDKESSWDEIHPTKEQARRVGAEVEALKLELDAPARVQLIDRAEFATRP